MVYMTKGKIIGKERIKELKPYEQDGKTKDGHPEQFALYVTVGNLSKKNPDLYKDEPKVIRAFTTPAFYAQVKKEMPVTCEIKFNEYTKRAGMLSLNEGKIPLLNGAGEPVTAEDEDEE